MKAINVYYDPQQNKYFTIDKQTGEVQPANKNGSSLKRFKAEYSGSDYHIRKEMERDLSPNSLIKQPFHVHYQHKHTVPVTFNKNIEGNSNINIHHQHNKSNGIINSKKKQLQGDLSASRIQSILSRETKKFQSKLSDFTKIKENLKMQNHSPRGNIQGTFPYLQLPKEYNNTITTPVKKNGKNHKKATSLAQLRFSQADLPDYLLLKNQLKKQRQIFFKYNNKFTQRKNDKLEKELKDRKQNMKMLEKLNLSKNDKLTSQVYYG